MNRILLALALAGVSSSPAWAQNKPAAAPAAKPPTTAPAAAGNVAPANANPNAPAADVNGDKILLRDLNRIVGVIKDSDPGLQTGSPAALKAIEELKQQKLDELITNLLLAQEAKRKKVSVQPKDLDDAFSAFKSGFKNEAEFLESLKNENVTVADVKKSLTDDLATREWAKQVSADITVTDDDIGAFYRANLDQFKIPEGVKARHIMLALNPNAPQADKDAVNKRAQNLIAQLKNKKADFAALAKANSDDATTKANGGDMGAFPKGEMIPAIDDACFAPNVKAGDILGPITTDFGVHIVRVDEKIPARQLTLEDVKANPQIGPALKAQLLKNKVQKRLDDKIAALRASAKIQKYV